MKTIITFILAIAAYACYSQPYTISGRVVKATGKMPIEGATVTETSIQTTVITDANGFFSLTANDSVAAIHVSHVGYIQQQISLSFPLNQPLLIFLEPANATLEEVLVSTGYENIALERATGSFEKIDSALLNRSVGIDIIGRLENITTGLHFDKREYDFNAPGPPEHEIYLHGISTLRQTPGQNNNAPLIVLDNFPYEGDLSSINPNDIKSVTLLKDAAAASIWGAKAGNGVIVISSKKANYNQPIQIGFTSNISITGKPDLFEHKIISTSDLIDIEKFLFEQGFYTSVESSRAKPALPPAIEILIKGRDGVISEAAAVTQIDALRENDIRNDLLKYVYRNAINQQYALNLNSGAERHRLSLTLGYDKIHKNRKGNDNSRFSVRLGNGVKITDKLELNGQFRWVRSEQASLTDSYLAYFNGGHQFPYVSLAGSDGSPLAVPKDYRLSFVDTAGAGQLLDWHYRPLNEIERVPRRNTNEQILANMGMSYTPVNWLSLEARYQYGLTSSQGKTHHGIDSYYARDLINRGTEINGEIVDYHFPYGGILTTTNGRSIAQQGRGQILIRKNWASEVRLNALAGIEIQQVKSSSNGSTLYGYDDNFLTFASGLDHSARYPVYANLASSGTIAYPVSTPSENVNRFISVYSNASFSYIDKYTISLSARRDASNVFGVSTNNKWAPLWSAGLSWNISNEHFLSHIDWLDRLKVRATYGYSGNVDNSMSAYPRLSYINNPSSTGVLYPAAAITTPPNPSLRWEKVNQLNVGVDFSLLQNRLSGRLDVYRKRTVDLIDVAQLDPTTGFNGMAMNVANTESKGVDFQISSINLTNTVLWKTVFLFTFNNNWIVKTERDYNGPSRYVTAAAMSNIENTIAYPAYSYRWAGLDPQTGEPRGYVNGEISKDYRGITSRETSLDELLFHGSSRPLYFGSVRNDVGYKRVSLSFNISWKFAYYFRRRGLDYNDLFNASNGHIDFYSRWQSPGDERSTHVPALEYPIGRWSSFYQYAEVLIEKGDHIRLQDIRLQYDFPLSTNKRVRRVSVFVYANNIGFLWRANRLKLDPDYQGNIPSPRNIAFGLNLNLN